MKLHTLVLVLSLAACGGHPPPAKSPEPAATTSSTLAIHDLSFYAKDELGLKLHADGRIEMLVKHSEGGKPAESTWTDIGVLHVDGTIVAKDGKTGALQADGSFKGPKGETSNFRLAGEELQLAGKHVTIDASGAFLLDGKAGEIPMRVEGASDAGSRRAALLIVGLMLDEEKNEAAATPQ
jgi:hypothetical protein